MAEATGKTKSGSTNGQIPKMKIPPTKYIVIGVIGIMTVILLFTVLRSLRRTELSNHSGEIKALERVIKAEGEKADAYLQLAEVHRENAEQLRKKDSLYQLQFEKNQINYTILNERLKNIPAYYQRIGTNDDSIRLAFSR